MSVSLIGHLGSSAFRVAVFFPSRRRTRRRSVLSASDRSCRSVVCNHADRSRRRGYSVIEASNGFEALEALEQKNGAVDLVVSDLVMPEMDGPTLLKAIRGRDREFKILFISGYAVKSMPNNRQIAFLPKPFTFVSLSQRSAIEPPGRGSVQAEHAVDGAQLGRLDQPRVCHCHPEQGAFELLLPEGEEIQQRRKFRKQIVILPDCSSEG
jgi:CheY-like chemotaxis protein